MSQSYASEYNLGSYHNRTIEISIPALPTHKFVLYSTIYFQLGNDQAFIRLELRDFGTQSAVKLSQRYYGSIYSSTQSQFLRKYHVKNVQLTYPLSITVTYMSNYSIKINDFVDILTENTCGNYNCVLRIIHHLSDYVIENTQSVQDSDSITIQKVKPNVMIDGRSITIVERTPGPPHKPINNLELRDNISSNFVANFKSKHPLRNYIEQPLSSIIIDKSHTFRLYQTVQLFQDFGAILIDKNFNLTNIPCVIQFWLSCQDDKTHEFVVRNSRNKLSLEQWVRDGSEIHKSTPEVLQIQDVNTLTLPIFLSYHTIEDMIIFSLNLCRASVISGTVKKYTAGVEVFFDKQYVGGLSTNSLYYTPIDWLYYSESGKDSMIDRNPRQDYYYRITRRKDVDKPALPMLIENKQEVTNLGKPQTNPPKSINIGVDPGVNLMDHLSPVKTPSNDTDIQQPISKSSSETSVVMTIPIKSHRNVINILPPECVRYFANAEVCLKYLKQFIIDRGTPRSLLNDYSHAPTLNNIECNCSIRQLAYPFFDSSNRNYLRSFGRTNFYNIAQEIQAGELEPNLKNVAKYQIPLQFSYLAVDFVSITKGDVWTEEELIVLGKILIFAKQQDHLSWKILTRK
nr:minor coat protein [Areca palm velarivirus 1]